MAKTQEFDPLVKPKAQEMGEEFGTRLDMPFSTAWTSPTGQVSQELYRPDDDTPSVSQLMQMRKTDGQARALYRLIVLPIRSALSSVTWTPAEGGEKEAEFIEQMFTLAPQGGGMTSSLNRVISEMLLAVFDGFSCFEQVYQVPKYGPLKGKIVLRKLAYRPSDTVTFLLDDSGGFDGFRQRAYFKGQTVDIGVPRDRALYFAVQEEERPFYGISYFQSAFYHYDVKRKLYWLAHLAAQHRAVGTRIGEVPNSASDIDKRNFRTALEDFGVMQAMTVPPGFKVDHQYPGGSFDYMQLINHHNSQMSKSVLASFFDESHGGDKSLVDFGHQSDALFLMALQAIMGDIAEVINVHLIPKFVDWNFGTAKYPEFTWGPFTDEQKESINETFNKLSVAGQSMTVSEDFMFELEKIMAEDMGLPVDYEAVAAERAEAKAAAKAQAEAFNARPDAAGLFGGATDGSGAPNDGSGGQGTGTDESAGESSTEVDVNGQYYRFSALPVSETLDWSEVDPDNGDQ